MKKIVAAVGVAALGVSAVQVATAAGVSAVDPSRPWSVSCALRGFYDDNYETAPKGQERDTLGASISPSIAFNMPLDQTTLGMRYTYGAYWYQDREDQSSANSAWDQSHQFDAFLNHAFTERYTLDVTESFVMSQEPSLLSTTASGVSYPYRTEGDNIRNYAQATFNGTLTRQLSFVVGYQNTYYNYENSGGAWNDPQGNSLSGLLDRMEQTALFNLRWQAKPQTVLVLGYNYGTVGYNSDEFILNPAFYTVATSEARNNRSHYVYAGFDQNFSKDLLLTLRGGAQFMDYYNDPLADDGATPYGQLSLSYFYLPGSSLQVGWTLSHNQTDILEPVSNGGSFTSDQMSSVLYASVNHRFNSRLTGTLSGSWQVSEFNGGTYDGQNDNFFEFGLNLAYRFNQYLSGEVGYNYYFLSSDIPSRDYDRNRVYLGVVAAY